MAYIVIFSIFVHNLIYSDMKRIDYVHGQNIGNYDIQYIEESNKIGEKRAALFMCHCGSKFTTTINNVRADRSKSCGCNIGEFHGMKGTKYYNLWRNIKERCYNKNNPRHKDYGSRGIKMNSEWINSFTKFYNYISQLDGFGKDVLSLDRIDNNGNYESNNLRWTNGSIQATNKRSSYYTGVYYDKSINKYRPNVTYKNNRVWLGCFDEKKPAIIARNLYIKENKLPHKLQESGIF